MLAMVLDGIFHKTNDVGLHGNIPKNWKKKNTS